MKNTELSSLTNSRAIFLQKINILIIIVCVFSWKQLAANDGFPSFIIAGEGFFCYQSIEKAKQNASKDAEMKAIYICQRANLKHKYKKTLNSVVDQEQCYIISKVEFTCVE